MTQSILGGFARVVPRPARMAMIYQSHRQPLQALGALREALHIYDRDPTLFIAAADAAITCRAGRGLPTHCSRRRISCASIARVPPHAGARRALAR